MAQSPASEHGARAPRRRAYSRRRPPEQRREQLLEAALRVADKRGFSELTVESVAREAGLAKTVIYNTVGNQEELRRALIEREQQRAFGTVLAAIPPLPLSGDPIEVLRDAMQELLEAVAEHPRTWRLSLIPPGGAPPVVRRNVDRYRRGLLEVLEPLVAWGLEELGASKLDPEIATHALLATIEHGIQMVATEPDRFPPKRIAAFAAEVLTLFRAGGG